MWWYFGENQPQTALYMASFPRMKQARATL
jgi:hypothetical protein